MKKFWIFNQQEEELFETSSGRFNCGILELFDVFVVKVSAVDDEDIVTGTAGIYRDVQEAADAVADLKDFANRPTEADKFVFPMSSDPITPLEMLAKFEAQMGEYKGDFTEADILNRNDRIIEAVIELLAKNNFLLR